MNKLLYKYMYALSKQLWRFTSKLHRLSGKWVIHVFHVYNFILDKEYRNGAEIK